jgi:tetratricopeptide (TPR) repeat protein
MADPTVAEQVAAQRASDDIFSLSGRDQYFAWFNRGTSLMLLQDYAGAAAAYDSAFSLYPNISADERPWRMLWYQTGPYFAYYYSQRYGDVISLATTTLSAMDEAILEESYYWRGLAREALGDRVGAVDDYRAALEHHPDFGPAVDALDRLGATP